MLQRPEEYRKMANVESDHWWYRSLHKLVLDGFKKLGVSSSSAILDAGCGTGGLLVKLREKGFKNSVGFDASPYAVEICECRDLSVRNARLQELSEEFSNSSFEVIISNDTLYFLTEAEQEKAMLEISNLLKPGGTLVLNLPMFKQFQGIHDRSVGLSKRFERKDINRLQNAGNFSSPKILYWPFLLSPILYCVRSFQRLRLSTQKDLKLSSDIDLPPGWLNSFLYFLTSTENTLLPWKPWGSSAFICLKKPKLNDEP